MKLDIKIGNLFLLFIMLFASSCKKYLDKKTTKLLYVPKTLVDLQALLDDNQSINANGASLMEFGADNYYVTTTDWQIYDPSPTSNYIFDKDANASTDWTAIYTNPVYYSNIVLDQLSDIELNNIDSTTFKNVKGQALFHRAFAFFQLAQVYCKPYSASANTDMGVILKISSPITEKVSRASLKQTYNQIISDLILSIDLLPITPLYPTRPCKSAAYGALARIFLLMRDYEKSEYYANAYLQKDSVLLDYNSLPTPTGNAPFFNIANPEIIFFAKAYGSPFSDQNVSIIDSTLYNSYNDNDIRKTVFFRFRNNQWRFKGSYDGNNLTSSVFIGITTDEMYLTRAESYARRNNIISAMADLNKLMIKRWKNNNGTWVPFSAANSTEALNKILEERRRELIFRGLRWSDLKRFNQDGGNITLKRIIGGNTYTLPPDDPRWVILIPGDEVRLSGIPQNYR